MLEGIWWFGHFFFCNPDWKVNVKVNRGEILSQPGWCFQIMIRFILQREMHSSSIRNKCLASRFQKLLGFLCPLISKIFLFDQSNNLVPVREKWNERKSQRESKREIINNTETQKVDSEHVLIQRSAQPLEAVTSDWRTGRETQHTEQCQNMSHSPGFTFENVQSLHLNKSTSP